MIVVRAIPSTVSTKKQKKSGNTGGGTGRIEQTIPGFQFSCQRESLPGRRQVT